MRYRFLNTMSRNPPSRLRRFGLAVSPLLFIASSSPSDVGGTIDW
jgi:hypothetical protein